MQNAEPGEVHYLPAEEGSHDKDEPRPHVVLSLASENTEVVTLAFATSSDLQASQFYAAHVVVDAASSLFKATGLKRTSYIYPSRLAVCFRADLSRPDGKIIDEFPELRDVQLPRAIGLGMGTSFMPGRAFGSLRGRIARLQPEFAEMISAEFGLVISEPNYSNRSQIQNLIPIFDGRLYELPAPSFRVEAERWLEETKLEAAFIGVQYAQGVYKSDILVYLNEPVDPDTMSRVDEGLAARLFGARVVDVLGGTGEDA